MLDVGTAAVQGGGATSLARDFQCCTRFHFRSDTVSLGPPAWNLPQLQDETSAAWRSPLLSMATECSQLN